jgi:hypothetical protein
MSSRQSDEEAMKDYLRVEDYKEDFKAIKEDLYSRVMSEN